jgi:hypothetical protein
VVSSTPRPHFTPGKNPVPILQVAGWAPGPVWTGGKSRRQRDSIPDRPARSQSLLSYTAQFFNIGGSIIHDINAFINYCYLEIGGFDNVLFLYIFVPFCVLNINLNDKQV